MPARASAMNHAMRRSPRRRTDRRAAQAGFTLLEAIIAMVIMATTLLALYAWLSTNTIAVSRAQAVSQGLDDARIALAVIEGINPMQDDRGEWQVGPVTVRWTAEPISDRRTGITQGGSAAPYDFTLYEMQVETLRDGRTTHAFQLRRSGWLATQIMDPDDY